MTIYKFPPSDSSDNNDNRPPKNPDDPKIVKPEFIIIEDDRVNEQGPFAGPADAQLFDSLKKLRATTLPWWVHICTAIVSVSAFIVATILSCLIIIVLALYLITLGQIPLLSFLVEKGWMVFKYLLVISLGSFVATFYPSYGFAIIGLYFLLIGEGLNSDLMARFNRMQKPNN